jgi:hypothetical protein
MYVLLTLNVMLMVNLFYQAMILNVVRCRVWYLSRQIKKTPNGLPTAKMLTRMVCTMSSSSFLAMKTLSENVDPVTMRDFLISYESGQCHSV